MRNAASGALAATLAALLAATVAPFAARATEGLVPTADTAATRPPAAAPRPGESSASRAQVPSFYLSWHAPHGMPGAAAECAPACADTVHRDTLYLSFEPTADESTMIGFAGDVYVYAQPGDTLGSFWSMDHKGANDRGLVIQFGPDESFPGAQPWPVVGPGGALYDRTPASGRYRFFYAVAKTHAGPVKARTRYVLGRMIIGARHPGLTGCERPVCIEWRRATFSFGTGNEVLVTKGGSRAVTWGPAGRACRDRIPGWRPAGAGSAREFTPPADRKR